jgi:nucleoside-diphosphate kinase
MPLERTFIMVKPDGVQRRLVSRILGRFEDRGLKLVGLKLMKISKDLAEEHYGEHQGKPFFRGLIDFITSGPVVAMVWEGQDAVQTARSMMGKTNPLEASPGTLRGDYALFTGNNIVHGSDSIESAAREIRLFFDEKDVLDYTMDTDRWVYGDES